MFAIQTQMPQKTKPPAPKNLRTIYMDKINDISPAVKIGAASLGVVAAVGVGIKTGGFSKMFKAFKGTSLGKKFFDNADKIIRDYGFEDTALQACIKKIEKKYSTQRARDCAKYLFEANDENLCKWTILNNSYTGNVLQDMRIIFTKRVILEPKIKSLGANIQGVNIMGPDCQGKEQLMSEIIKELSEGGYHITHIPRFKNGNYDEILDALCKAMEASKELFTQKGERTAIIVRDLQDIAVDRNLNHPSHPVVAQLLHTEHAIKDGYVWISESKYSKTLDRAVIRHGRTDTQILAKPLPTDSKEAWLCYLQRHKEAVDNPGMYSGGAGMHKWLYEDALASIPKEYLK